MNSRFEVSEQMGGVEVLDAGQRAALLKKIGG